MQKIIKLVLFVVCLVSGLASCDKMNDRLDVYLASGERIYIGKIDSMNTFVGDNRVKLRFWATDPRAKRVGFYWYPNNDSMFVDITPTFANNYFEIYIGGVSGSKAITEGNYTMRVITSDKANHYSIPFEKVVNIYGDKYRSTLTNRVLTTVAYTVATSSLSLTFSGPTSDKEIGIGIQYFDKSGVAKSLVLPLTSITTPLVIPNVEKTKTVTYRTMFLPEPLAIDTFYTISKNIVIP